MKLNFRWALIFVLSALLENTDVQHLAWAAQSNPPLTENSNEVPFKLRGGHGVVVRGSVGHLGNLNFLVDTGAVPSVLDLRIADKLHVRGNTVEISAVSKTVRAQWVDAPDVRVGPVHVDKLRVVVRDLTFASDALGTRIDAMIGLDLLGQSPFTVDYEAKKIVFGPIDPSLATIPYHPGLPFAVVDLQIHGETLPVLVDTGTSDFLLFESAIRNCRSSIRMSRVENRSNMGGEMHLTQAQITEVSLGSAPWGPRQVYVVQDYGEQPFRIAGLLGAMQLSTKRIAFDPEHGLVAWAR